MSIFLRRLPTYFRRVLLLLIPGSFCGIVMNTAVVLPPIVLGRAIDEALAIEQGNGSIFAVGQLALLFIAATMATELPRVAKRWLLKMSENRIKSEIRADALTEVLRRWPMERLRREPVGDLMARIVADVDVAGVGIREMIVESWDTVLLEISLFVALCFYDWRLTILVMLPIPFGLLLAHFVGGAVRRRTLVARRANGTLTEALQEMLAGFRLLRLFGQEEPVARRIDRLSLDLALANLAAIRLRGGLAPVYGFVMTSGVIALFVFGGQEVIAGHLSTGAFVAYLDIYLRFLARTPRVPQLLNSVQTAAAAFSRLEPLLPRQTTPVAGRTLRDTLRPNYVEGSADASQNEHPITHPQIQGSIEARHIHFRYPGTESPALVDVSFRAAPGSLVAITGPVGSGKSALARALLGLYPLQAGEVLLGGRDMASFAGYERDLIATYVPQDGFIFSGTIVENVVFGGKRDANVPIDSRVREALHTAALEADLTSFQMGANTTVGEMGVRISGGQRQRIALARAVAPGPAILILDDPFSAVDVETERVVIGRLCHAPDRPTILLLSHRLAAFPLADQIIVLDKGRIAEQGTHNELLSAGGLYARIYNAQVRAGVITTPAAAAAGDS